MQLIKFKMPSLLGRKPPEETGAPVFAMVGSLAGVTRKDALQFVRGLAEANVQSPALGRYCVTEDKAGDRFIYEIHEGGIEFSIAEKVVAALDAGQVVDIQLANSARLTVADSHGELYSLIHPADDAAKVLLDEAKADKELELETGELPKEVEHHARSVDISTFSSSTKLLELFPENTKLFKIGLILMAVSFVAFMTAGSLYTLKQAGWLSNDSVLMLTKAGHSTNVADSPAWQLELARKSADKAGTTIKVLKKGPTGWSWELAQ